MHIEAIALGGLALSWAFWHLAYLVGGRAQRDLEIAAGSDATRASNTINRPREIGGNITPHLQASREGGL